MSAREAAPMATKGPVLSSEKGEIYYYMNGVQEE